MSFSLTYRKNIPLDRWDELVLHHSAGRPYAHSCYLDCVAGGQWEAIIDDNFNWVMPLPYNRKLFGFKQYYQPFFCQQLGIIGSHFPDVQTQIAVIKLLRRKAVRTRLQLNEDNTELKFLSENIKKNLVLNLDTPYSEIKANYKPALRRKLKKVDYTYQVINSDDSRLFTDCYSKFTLPKVSGSLHQRFIRNLIEMIFKNKLGEINFLIVDSIPIAGQLILKSDNRIINLMPFTDSKYIALNGQAVLLDELIRQNAGKNILLDFEGSAHPGIAQFFRSFGSENRPFPILNIR